MGKSTINGYVQSYVKLPEGSLMDDSMDCCELFLFHISIWIILGMNQTE